MKAIAILLAVLFFGVPSIEMKSPMTEAASKFLATLSKDQRRQAIFPLTAPDRTTWTYLPGERKGVAWCDLTEPQKAAARDLLRASLSKEGFEKVEDLRGLEAILRVLEGGNMSRDPEKYWFVFFGTPSGDSSWHWRYEGHHLSLSFASDKGMVVSSTPQFLGSSPAEVKSGEHRGLRLLGKEQDLGFRLAESLTAAQRSKALLGSKAPADIITASSRKAAIEGKLGIPYSELDTGQQKLLRDLISVHASVQTKEEQKRRLDVLDGDGYKNLVFAWIGPVRRDARHYYRIQGKSFVIEYDNTQDDGNHIHTVWRDFEHDFGGDALASHYADSH